MNPVKGMRVRDIMVTKPVVFTSDTDLLDAVSTLVDRHITGAPVVDARGNLVGLLTERDFLQATLVAGYHGERGGCVGDYMSRDVEAVNADDSLLDVATRFIETKRRRYPVIEDNRVVGVVVRRDVLRAVMRAFELYSAG
ncbi:MAG: CBS domain-containing protein [Myxococcales bacterium]|nr:CBS domain-containing protein [Deltaproteobacteria bacterium]NNE17383.1 CBS domain-containing protein [Myxococcales bacterium]